MVARHNWFEACPQAHFGRSTVELPGSGVILLVAAGCCTDTLNSANQITMPHTSSHLLNVPVLRSQFWGSK